MLKFYLIFIPIVFLSCQPKELPTLYKVDANETYLKLSHMTTKSELSKIKEEMKAINFGLNFDKSIFFPNGKIRQLSMFVILPDGTIGTCGADLTSMQFKYYGFEYTPQSSRKFRAGSF